MDNEDKPQHPYHLTDPRFKWVPSWMTDVQRTWKKFGWVPPSEKKGK